MIEAGCLARMLLQVFQKGGILADRHLVFINQKRRQAKSLALLINELSGGNLDHTIKCAHIPAPGTKDKPPERTEGQAKETK